MRRYKICPNTGRGQWSTGPERTIMTTEFPDPVTAVFTFADPNPLFMYNVARGQPFAPTDHMQQFHEDFADTAELEAETKEAGYDTWDKLFDNRMRPLIDNAAVGRDMDCENCVWRSAVRDGAQPVLLAQVDSSGNQLPYVDKVNHLLFEAPDAFGSRVLAGEIDYQSRHVSIGNFTLFKESEESGDYRVLLGVSASHVALPAQPHHQEPEAARVLPEPRRAYRALARDQPRRAQRADLQRHGRCRASIAR